MERQEALVQAAYELLAERGFEGLRTRDVAAKEGAIAKPAKPDELAALIVATLKGLFMLSGDDREPKAVDRQLRALERLIA